MQKFRLNLRLFAVLAGVSVGTIGCKTRFSVASPAPPELPAATTTGTIDTTKPFAVTRSYTVKNYTDDLSAYNTAVAASISDPTQLAKAKWSRNNVIWGEMGAIEGVYTVYHTRLFSDKNTVAIGSDVMTLGLTAASTIAGHAATKTLLSALGTAFAGVGLSVDKNYFGQQSFQILGLAMQTRRDKVRTAIATNLNYCDINSYPLLQAQRDLIQYFSAGTLDSALQELQEEAGTATANASAGGANPVQPVSVTPPPPVTTCPIGAAQALAPAFNPPAGPYSTPQSVTITDTTAGATIYYTTNGAVPTTSATVYTTPIAVSATTTIQAIASGGGFAASPVTSAAYTITLPQAATPTFNPAAGSFTTGQTVTIADATPGATIYYTVNGSVPTSSSTAYTSPFTVSATGTVQAIATASGYTTSAVASAAYTISPSPPPSRATAPTFNPPAGSYSTPQSVAIADATPGVTIYYTVDGASPTTSSTVYTALIPVSSTVTIQAIASGGGSASSSVASAAYTITQPQVSTPTFTPTPGSYSTGQSISIDDATPGATIYYTTDGSVPTTSSTLYSRPIAVSTTITLQAIAAAPGHTISPVASAAYTIAPQVSRPAVLTPH